MFSHVTVILIDLNSICHLFDLMAYSGASISNPDNMDFSDDNELDICNLVDSDEPELRRLDDLDDIKIQNPNKVDDSTLLTKFDVVGSLLSDWGADGISLTEKFKQMKIEYKDLAALSDSDLMRFGVNNKEIRMEMLEIFANLPNQYESYDTAIRTASTRQFENDGFTNIHKHLQYLKLAITKSLLNLQVRPAEDICVSEDKNASELVVRTLKEMRKTSNIMEEQLLSLSSNKNRLAAPSSSYWKIMLLLSFTAVGSAMVIKYCRTKMW